MKRFLTGLLSTILTVTVLAGVRVGVTTLVENGFAAGAIKKLAGTYETKDMIPADTAESILLKNDFYPEEVVFAELTELYVPKFVEFHSDKTYTYYYDADGYRDNIETFFRQFFDNMYVNRTALTGLYDADFTHMSQAEFEAYYATLYGENSFDDLIRTLSYGCWDYEALANDVETGTFTVNDNKIIYTQAGTTLKEHVTYKKSGDTLTLTYSDGEEIYSKIA